VAVLDVPTAYLGATLKEEVYLKLPKAKWVDDPLTRERPVVLLQKSVPGLKQSGRCWFNDVSQFIINQLHLRASVSAPGLYYSDDVILNLYVDDILITAPNHQLELLCQEFRRRFQAKGGVVTEPTFTYVGLVIRRDREKRQIWISQEAYVTKVLARFGMENSARKLLPMQSNWKPHARKDEEEACDQGLYRQAIGSLLYAALGSRPDIAYAVGILGRYASDPSIEHWGAVKHLLRYLNGTRNFELALLRQQYRQDGIIAYSDADHAGDQDGARSTSGWLIFLNGALIIWKSKKQGLVAHSTMEAELIGMDSAYRQASWLRDVAHEIGRGNASQTITLRGDNTAGENALRNGFPNATRHLRIRYHAIRDHIESNDLMLEHVTSKEQLADGLTKPLGSVKHAAFVKEIGLTDEKRC
jgi:hypothetical protein